MTEAPAASPDLCLDGVGRVPDRPLLGPGARLHHVGVAVRSIREVDPFVEVFVERTQGVALAFVSVGGVTLELLEPLGQASPVARSVGTGRKLVHLCFSVPDLEEAVRRGRAAGFHRLSRPVSAPALGNRRIVWLFGEHYGLVELLESADPSP